MVSADHAPSALDPAVAGRAHRAVEPLHNHVYFAPETEQHLTAVGLRPGRMCYFAGRAAPMGAVGPGVVTATFYNFSPSLVARHIPRAWTLVAPEQVVAARLDAARASLTRLLGDAATGPEVAELAGLVREACGSLVPGGAPALRRARRPALARRRPGLALARRDAAARVARRRAHRLPGAGRSSAASRRCSPTRSPAAASPSRRRRPAAAGATRSGRRASAALADRGLVDDSGLTTDGHALRQQAGGGDRPARRRGVAAPRRRAPSPG